MYIDTRFARFDAAPGDACRPTSTPIYQTATYEQESALSFGEYDYTRSGNPTRTVLQERLAELESARFGYALSSGMAALSTFLRSAFGTISRGGERGRLIVGSDLYGGTTRLIERLIEPLGVQVERVDTTDLLAVEATLNDAPPAQTWILLESPSNPLLRVTDITSIAELARKVGARLAVDNTAMSPYLQNPLELGAHVVLHSATKHLGGHGDVLAGAVMLNDEALAEEIAFLQNAEGTALSPFDSWLLLRGMKTLSVRISQETKNAQALADFLESNDAIRKVHYPGLAIHPGFVLQSRQARGAGQLLSFETGSAELSKRLCEETKLFSIAVSFGSTCSTISMPCHMSHASVSSEAIASGRVAALPSDLVRLSVGLEDPRDLILDLESVLNGESADRTKPAFSQSAY